MSRTIDLKKTRNKEEMSSYEIYFPHPAQHYLVNVSPMSTISQKNFVMASIIYNINV